MKDFIFFLPVGPLIYGQNEKPLWISTLLHNEQLNVSIHWTIQVLWEMIFSFGYSAIFTYYVNISDCTTVKAQRVYKCK